MLVSFSTWGDCPYDEGATYCWNDPKERAGLMQYIEEMGRIYGPYADHVNVHIGDPGGCTRNGCDPSYETPQQITNAYIAMHRVQDAYSKLPDSARDKIRINSCEITFHGWPQIINQYCAARLMWNPKENLEVLEREFCSAAFGPANADAMVALYQACENGVTSHYPRPRSWWTCS